MTSLLSSKPPQSQRVGPDGIQEFDPDAVDFEPLLVTGSKLCVLLCFYYVAVLVTHREVPPIKK